MRFKTVGRRLHEMYCISALVRGAQRMGDPPRRISDERQITRLFGDLNTAVSGHPPELGIAELEGRRGRQLVLISSLVSGLRGTIVRYLGHG